MPDYPALRSWVDANAAGLPDALAADAYNAAGEDVPRRVPLDELARYAHDSGVYGRLLVRLATPLPDQADASYSALATAKAVAAELMDIFHYRTVPDVNVANPRFAGGLQALVAAGDVTAGQAGEIAAMGVARSPLYAQDGGFGVPAGPADVAHARSL